MVSVCTDRLTVSGVQPEQAAGPAWMGSDLGLSGSCQLPQNTASTRACWDVNKQNPKGALSPTV